jgi:hypothetical protein
MAHSASMQVIAVPNPTGHADRVATLRSLAVGVLLVLAGVALGWLCLATPLVSGFIPYGRPTPLEMAAGILVWSFAIVIPAAFLIMGVVRLVSVAGSLGATRPRRVTPHLAQALGPDHLAATDLVVPGGRRIHEMVLGPFGIAVLGDVPPRSATRHVGDRWEIRDGRGRWLPIESPVQRASRDAERVRGWLATDDRDFLVRVYAAIVTDDPTIERSPTCAVVAPKDLAAWLEALPQQRGLTPARREHLVELVRELAAAQRG